MKRVQLEPKKRSGFFLIILNLALAAIIYSQAELGRLLGIQEQPLAISVVWPATGFSLAALLLFGKQTLPGIFLGNFCYNFLHLSFENSEIFPSFLASLSITLGSTFQAFLGNWILRRFTSPGYFNTVKDIFIFLIPAGLIVCLFASSVGTATFYFYRPMDLATLSSIWLTFWIGDLMGVYIFTPFLVVWTTLKPQAIGKALGWETLAMFGAFVVVTFLTFGVNYSLIHLYLPLTIWIAYRFGIHGATLAVFIITLTIILPTIMGHGPFTPNQTTNPLLILVIYLEILVASALLVAAVVKEREAAWNQIQDYNVDLQEAVAMYRSEIGEREDDIYIKHKLASLGLLSSGIAMQMQLPLEGIKSLTRLSLDSLRELRTLFDPLEDKMAPDLSIQFRDHFDSINHYLTQISKQEAEAGRIAEAIEQQSHLAVPHKMKARSINISTLLIKCLEKAAAQTAKQHPEFTYSVIEELDRNVKIILAVPEDLAYAFYYLITHAIDGMKEKRDRLGSSYTPVLKVRTRDLKERIEVVIRDNGSGASEQELAHFFFPLTERKTPSETINLPIAIAHEIITHLYEGELKLSSEEGEYLQINIILPK